MAKLVTVTNSASLPLPPTPCYCQPDSHYQTHQYLKHQITNTFSTDAQQLKSTSSSASTHIQSSWKSGVVDNIQISYSVEMTYCGWEATTPTNDKMFLSCKPMEAMKEPLKMTVVRKSIESTDACLLQETLLFHLQLSFLPQSWHFLSISITKYLCKSFFSNRLYLQF